MISCRRNSRKSQSVSRTLQAEQPLDDVVVAAADHLAVPRVAAPDLVALHDVDVVGGQRHEQRCLAGVVLGVAVGVEDPLVAGPR